MVSVEELSVPEGSTVVTMGNFDGLHRGHQALLKSTIERARIHNATSVVVTFDPHTRAVVSPDSDQPILTTLREKAMILQLTGIDQLVWVPFNEQYAAMDPVEFIEKVLIGRLNAREIVLGKGHSFGKNRTGNEETLRKLMHEKHFYMFVSDLVSTDGPPISSTGIRGMIAQARIEEAVKLLGHPYPIVATRKKGEGIARTLGFPTVNFETPSEPKVLPPPGVYAAQLQFGSGCVKGAFYRGECPTFQGRTERIEFHALERPSQLPSMGDEACLWLHTFVRADRAFENADELAAQIQNDVTKVKRYFS